MRKLFAFFFTICWSLSVYSQNTPEEIGYQAVMRDAGGALLANQSIGVKVTFLNGGVNGSTVYIETHTAQSNDNGLISFGLGGGNVIQGAFDSIPWEDGDIAYKLEYDLNGGTNYTLSSTQTFSTVPFAKHADIASDLDVQGDPMNGDVLYRQNGEWHVVSKPTDMDSRLALGHSYRIIWCDLWGGPRWSRCDRCPSPHNVSLKVNEVSHYSANVIYQVRGYGCLLGATNVILKLNGTEVSNNQTHPEIPLPDNHTFSNLDPATTYEVEIKVDISYEIGGYTSTAKTTFTTPNPGPPAPSRPELLYSSDNILVLGVSKMEGKDDRNQGSVITAAGIRYISDTSTTPIMVTSTKDTTVGSSNFHLVRLTGLTPATEYNVSSFATNVSGTGFSNYRRVKTIPTPEFNNDTVWVTSHFTMEGFVDPIFEDDEYENSVKGFVWGDSINPVVGDSSAMVFVPLDSTFEAEISPLLGARYYHVRAFSTNPNGTFYGRDFYLRTDFLASGANQTDSAGSRVTGYVIGLPENGNAITERGIYVDNQEFPDTASLTSYLGSFQVDIDRADLSGCIHPYQVYVKDVNGIPYLSRMGKWFRFTDNTCDQSGGEIPPVVTTGSASGITDSSAVVGVNIIAGSATDWGIQYSLTQGGPYPYTSVNGGSGIGAYSVTLTGLTASTLYYARAYATNSGGTGYGNEISFTTSAPVVVPTPFACGDSIEDAEGNWYSTVQIGTQCWMQENLNTSLYADSTAIATGFSEAAWNGQVIGAFAHVDGDANNDATYGKLYNWYTVEDARGVCPTGWSVPDSLDWADLMTSQGGQFASGGALKSTTGWDAPNVGASNASGFTALPAGTRDWLGFYGEEGSVGYFYVTDEFTNFGLNHGVMFMLRSDAPLTVPFTQEKTHGASIRCIKD